jgi:hypothetical protein
MGISNNPILGAFKDLLSIGPTSIERTSKQGAAGNSSVLTGFFSGVDQIIRSRSCDDRQSV